MEQTFGCPAIEDEPSAPFWACLKIMSGKEEKFAEYLRTFHPFLAPVYFPTYVRRYRPHKLRRAISVTLRLFPGYVFCLLRDNSPDVCLYTSVPIAKGRFLKDADGYLERLRPSVIAQMRQYEMDGTFAKLLNDPWRKPGDHLRGKEVTVTGDNNVFAGMAGAVVKMRNRKTVVLDMGNGRELIVPSAMVA